jgi:hypothetical protein
VANGAVRRATRKYGGVGGEERGSPVPIDAGV